MNFLLLMTNYKLLIRENVSDKYVGMISVKDIVKCTVTKQEAFVEKLRQEVVKE